MTARKTLRRRKRIKKEKKARESLVSDAGWNSKGNLSSNSLIPLPGRPLWQTSELNFRSYGIRGILRRTSVRPVIRSAIILRSVDDNVVFFSS